MLSDIFHFIMVVVVGGGFCGGFVLSMLISWIVRFLCKYGDDKMQIKLDKFLDNLIVPCVVIGAIFMYVMEYHSDWRRLLATN
jgi:fructose-specific phosphotransferase system IIC component